VTYLITPRALFTAIFLLLVQPEIATFDPPNMKPNSSQHNTQQEVYRTTCREILSFKFFHMIGRQSVVNILNWCHTPFFATLGTYSARGVKKILLVTLFCPWGYVRDRVCWRNAPPFSLRTIHPSHRSVLAIIHQYSNQQSGPISNYCTI